VGGQGCGPQRPPHQLGKHDPDVSCTRGDKQLIYVINNCAFGSRSCTVTSTDGKSYSLEQASAQVHLHDIYTTGNGHTSAILTLTKL